MSSEIHYQPWRSNQNQPSPKWLLELFQHWYDPCPKNPEGLRELHGLGAIPEGITKVYIHPPYNESEEWVDRALRWQARATVAMLLKADNSTKWFKKLYMGGAHILFFNERLTMQGQSSSAPFPSILVILEALSPTPEASEE